MAQKTQLSLIKTHLETKPSITALEALGLYGVFRLAARIYELKAQGWPISTEVRYDPNGKQYAVYSLEDPTDAYYG